MPDADLEARLRGLARGERGVVAACLNDVEDERPAARARDRALQRALVASGASERAHRVGVTGPPGVGKSSLVAALARALRSGDARASPRTVGVVAVDPSSVLSGGALLGDRVRIAVGPEDAGLFIRSLATRGALGGLARAVPDLVLVLAAAFDVVIVETVGVGQSETDVRDLVDTLVFVVQPGAGDTLQHLKAGIMEVPDMFVVNKSDAGAVAAETRAELVAALESLRRAGVVREAPIVLPTSSRHGAGVLDLVAALDAHRDAARATGELGRTRATRSVARGVRDFSRRYGELGVERAGGGDAVRAAIAGALARGDDVASAVEQSCPFGDERLVRS